MSVCREEEEGVRLCEVVEGTDFGEREMETESQMYTCTGTVVQQVHPLVCQYQCVGKTKGSDSEKQ